MRKPKSGESVANVGFKLRREAGEVWAIWGDGREPLKLGNADEVTEAVCEFLKIQPA